MQEDANLPQDALDASLPPRLEWWGEQQDVTKVGLLRPLVGQEVVRLEHAVLDEWHTDPQGLAPANVVFTLRDGRRWEVLDTQSSDMRVLLSREVATDQDLVTAGDLQGEPGDQAWTMPVQGPHVPPPWTVAGITEVWSSVHDPVPFLCAVVLWGAPRSSADPLHSARFGLTPLLAMQTIGDDFWIASAEQVFAAMERETFSFRTLQYHFYDDRDA